MSERLRRRPQRGAALQQHMSTQNDASLSAQYGALLNGANYNTIQSLSTRLLRRRRPSTTPHPHGSTPHPTTRSRRAPISITRGATRPTCSPAPSATRSAKARWRAPPRDSSPSSGSSTFVQRFLRGDYIQGSTAVYVSNSTGTVIGGSVLVATNTFGSALQMDGGSVGLGAARARCLIGGFRGRRRGLSRRGRRRPADLVDQYHVRRRVRRLRRRALGGGGRADLDHVEHDRACRDGRQQHLRPLLRWPRRSGATIENNAVALSDAGLDGGR